MHPVAAVKIDVIYMDPGFIAEATLFNHCRIPCWRFILTSGIGPVNCCLLVSMVFVRKLLENPHLRKRADAENQIKELRYEYGMEGCCSESLAATEHAFRWVMVAYNMMSLFKQRVMGGKSYPSLATVQMHCIRKLHRTQRPS
jgi:hypothetical protein